MNPTERFFTKLRRLAVTLETETAELQQTFENRHNDADRETAAKAMRAYHELNGDVRNMKGQIQEQLAQQKGQENEVSSFIKACRVMEHKLTKDIQTLKGHWEKYGYQAPRDAHTPTKAKGQKSEADGEGADENDIQSTEEEGSQEEAGVDPSSSCLKGGRPLVIDVLRTPQLSDFGLSEMQLKRNLAGAEWSSEVPPMPEMILPHPSDNTPAPPPMPLTPKCALRMDDDELQTPQMHDFGISEHTMCLNNDFTMDLFRKNVEKPQRPPQDKPAPPVNSLQERLPTKANHLKSPEPPVFCTPGFKIKKTNHCSLPAPGNADPQSPGCPGDLPTTPELPAFQTPYMNRLTARQPEAIDVQADDDDDDDGQTFDCRTPPRNGATGSKRTWECSKSSIAAVDVHMPEMPNLAFVLGNSLLNRSAKMQKTTSEHEKVTSELTVGGLELDGPTQEFSLGTPRIRMDYDEPSTPEMPDLSSVTQDICKLLSHAREKMTAVAVVRPRVESEKEKSRAPSLSVVSEDEFQSLPSYLRQMSLSSLNQAIHNINTFTAQCGGEKTELQMEELRRVTNVGARTPIYILCLTELQRLQHVGGARNNSVYKLSTHN